MSIPSNFTHSVLKHGIGAFQGGHGDAVVLLPGWPQTAEAYAAVLPMLAKDYRVWVLDLPGLGQSIYTGSAYDTNSISRILAEALEDVGCNRYHLVGHDVGAWTAYAWAAQFPSSVRSLTLIDSTIPGCAPPMSFPLPDAANTKLWQFCFNRLQGLPEMLTEGKEKQFLNWLFDTKAKHADRVTPQARAKYLESYAQPGGMANGFAYYRAYDRSAEQNREHSRNRLAMPVLAVGGDGGAGELLKFSMKDRAERVESVVVEDCGHFVMEEQPAAFYAALSSFLRRHTVVV